MADTEVKQEAAWLKWTGIIVSVIQIILAVSFVGMVFWINIFPVKIEVIIIVVLILLSALALYLQFLKYGWVKWTARVIALLLAVILAIGDLYIYQAKEAMNYVSNNEQTEVISVYVLKDDEAKTIADAKDYIDPKRNKIKLNNPFADGTLVKKVSFGKTDSVELLDKMRALQWLADHMSLATEKQKAEIELLKAKAEDSSRADEEQLQEKENNVEEILKQLQDVDPDEVME